MKIALADITIDRDIQIRDGLSEVAIERYADMATDPPPITVFGPSNILADGFHRYEVARRRGSPAIEAERRKGGRDEAAEYAAIANLHNSEPLTRVERNRAVQRIADLHPDWSARKVAAETGVDVVTVLNIQQARRLRASLPPDIADATNGGGKPILTDTHLYRIAALPEAQREPVARRAVAEGWSEPETRVHVAEIKAGIEPVTPTVERPAAVPVLRIIRAVQSFFDTEVEVNGRTLTYRQIIQIVVENRNANELRDPVAPTAALADDLIQALGELSVEADRLATPLALTEGAR